MWLLHAISQPFVLLFTYLAGLIHPNRWESWKGFLHSPKHSLKVTGAGGVGEAVVKKLSVQTPRSPETGATVLTVLYELLNVLGGNVGGSLEHYSSCSAFYGSSCIHGMGNSILGSRKRQSAVIT